MENVIKSGTTATDGSIYKNNFIIGVDPAFDYGPTSATTFWNGIVPPSNGYTVYAQKSVDGPSVRVASNDAELITIAKQYGGTNIDTIYDALNYFNGQSNYLVTNINYPGIVTDGLVLNLDAGYVPSYPENGTTWGDLSGDGNNGTLVNGVGFDSADGGSLVFDGVNDSVVVPNSSSIGVSGDITILAWVNITDFNWLNSIVSKTLPNSYPAPYDFYLENESGRPNFLAGNGTVIGAVYGTNSPSTGVWQQIAITMSGTTVVHYLNGNTNGTGTISAAIANNPNYSLYVGNRIDNVTRLKGKLSNVQIYNRALSDAEVLQNYNALKSRFGL